MTPAFAVMFGFMVLLGGTAILGFIWAIRDGQLNNLRDGSLVIFDEEEPVGTPTDVVFKRRAKQSIRAVADVATNGSDGARK